jgi:hypothetical protein
MFSRHSLIEKNSFQYFYYYGKRLWIFWKNDLPPSSALNMGSIYSSEELVYINRIYDIISQKSVIVTGRGVSTSNSTPTQWFCKRLCQWLIHSTNIRQRPSSAVCLIYRSFGSYFTLDLTSNVEGPRQRAHQQHSTPHTAARDGQTMKQ